MTTTIDRSRTTTSELIFPPSAGTSSRGEEYHHDGVYIGHRALVSVDIGSGWEELAISYIWPSISQLSDLGSGTSSLTGDIRPRDAPTSSGGAISVAVGGTGWYDLVLFQYAARRTGFFDTHPNTSQMAKSRMGPANVTANGNTYIYRDVSYATYSDDVGGFGYICYYGTVDLNFLIYAYQVGDRRVVLPVLLREMTYTGTTAILSTDFSGVESGLNPYGGPATLTSGALLPSELTFEFRGSLYPPNYTLRLGS